MAGSRTPGIELESQPRVLISSASKFLHLESPMLRSNRLGRLSFVSLAAVLLAACAGQKEPAEKLIGDIQATVTAASTEAAKYIPDQLAGVQTQLITARSSLDQMASPTESRRVLGARADDCWRPTHPARIEDEVL